MHCNYHTHSIYCDGKNTISEMTERAVEEKIDQLGFSAHAPLPGDPVFAIKENDLENYIHDIDVEKKKQNNIQIFSGLECDFIPETTKPFSEYQAKYHLDFIIGGVHLVKPPHSDEWWFIDGPERQSFDDGLFNFFDGNIEKAVTQFWEQTFEMIETEKFDIIAHLDKIKMHNQGRFFSEEEKWYKTLADHALTLIHQYNLIVEINGRGIYRGRCNDFYPSDDILMKAAKRKLPFVISTDAHHVDDLVMLYQESVEKLRSMGINELVALDAKGNWKEYSINRS